MDLYRIAGKYHGTQAEARAAAKAAGLRFDPAKHSEKVPTDKAGLIAYLNEHLSAPAPASAPQRSAAVTPLATAERTLPALRPNGAIALLASMDDPDVDRVAEIICASGGYPLARYASAVAVAFANLGRLQAA